MRAIDKLSSCYGEVTVAHRYFALCCVKAKCYSHGLKVIREPSIIIESVQVMDVLNYNYYRGLLFTGLDMVSDAA